MFDGEIIVERQKNDNGKYLAKFSLRKRTGYIGASTKNENNQIIPMELLDNVWHEYRAHLNVASLYKTTIVHDNEKITLTHGDGILCRLKVRSLDHDQFHVTGFIIETGATGPQIYPFDRECIPDKWSPLISIRRSRYYY